jgi:hypothetical protein
MNLGYIKQATVGTPTITSGGRPLRAQPAPAGAPAEEK